MAVIGANGGFGTPALAAGHSMATLCADHYASGAGRTTGATLGAPTTADLQPALLNAMSVVGWSIQARLLLELNTAVTQNIGPHGLLGDIMAGLVFGDPPLAGTFTDHPPPASSSQVQKLFAGASDTPPPWAPATPVLLSVSQQLPQPIPLSNSAGVSVGIWMAPGIAPTLIAESGSSIADYFLSVTSASWTILYDNGKD